jgi:hypothetical protein
MPRARMVGVWVLAAAVLWAAVVAALIGRSTLALVPVIVIVVVWGFGFGLWIGDGRYAAYVLLPPAVACLVFSLVGVAAGARGAGLPVLLGTVPILITLPGAYAGGEVRRRRRDRSRWVPRSQRLG